jgi:two-component system cell cycle sensor histidine kinase/response regulator CckA
MTEVSPPGSTAGISESTLRAVAEGLKDAAFIVDLHGVITTWNDAAQLLYGQSAAGAVGRSMGAIFGECPIGERVSSSVDAGEQVDRYETTHRTPDGSLVKLSLSSYPVRDPAGRVIGALAIAREIRSRAHGFDVARQQDVRYGMLISRLSDAAVYQYDRDFRIVTARGPLLERYGLVPDDLEGKTIWELLPAASAESFAKHYRAALAGESHSFEWETSTGEVLEVDVVPLPDAEGNVVGSMVLARDISDRKRIERDLHFQAELLEHLEVAVVATDIEGRVTHWNRQAEAYYGLPRERALGRGMAEINPLLDLPDAEEQLVRLRSGAENRAEYRISSADGDDIRLFITGSGVHDEAGDLVGFVGVAVDITAARQVADDLHSARSLFEGAFEHAPIGIAVLDAGAGRAGTFVRVNGAMCEMLECRPADLIGRGVGGLLDVEVAACAPILQQAADGSGAVFQEGVHLRAASGRDVWADVSASLIRDPHGAPKYAVLLIRDITAARAAEAQREALEARLHRAQKLDALGRLAGGIAHDFNNLLSVILNYADLVAEELEEECVARADLDAIRAAAERGASLTQRLLEFGRREVVQPRRVDLSAIVEESDRLLGRTIGEDVELVTSSAADLWPLQADQSQLEQVVMNLALNARDAMHGGGRITVATCNAELGEETARRLGVGAGPYVRLTVTDEGSGMPADVAEQAFEPFFSTKPPGDGTGLGLATVYGIVTEMGGQIDLRSEPGKGTTVDVWLPASGCLETEPTSIDDELVPSGRGETVLVVDDSPSVRELAARMLAKAGYQVLEADGPEAASSMALAHPPELLVTDVVMPGISGTALAEVLRCHRPGLPVLLLSGYADPAAMRQELLARNVSFLAKPFTRGALLRAVRRALDETTASDLGAA